MDDKPRMVHVLHHDGAGGGPKVMRQLMEAARGRWEVAAAVGGEGALARWCRETGIRVRSLRFHPLPWVVVGWFQLWCFLRSVRPHVVVLHGQWAGPVGALAARAAGVRHIVYVAHCPAFYHSTSIFRALRNFVAEAIPCRLAERVVVLSQGNRTHYLVRKLVSPPKLVHIANGVDLQEVPSPPAIRAHRQAWNFDTCRFHAVFVGRLDDQKRVAWLLEAWALVARSLHGDASAARLWVVGEGEERHDLERQAETLKLGPTCTFVGARTQAWEWIAASDALVLSSLYEGHALVPLEAMACGLPVVATAVDGVVDSVIHGQTGLLSPPGDVQTFAWNILRLVSDPEFRTALGRRGRERVESFALATTLGRYQQLWEDLRTPPPRSPGVPT